jgi:hypothetical protein
MFRGIDNTERMLRGIKRKLRSGQTFKFWSHRCLLLLRVSWLSSIPAGSFWDGTSIKLRPLPSKFSRFTVHFHPMPSSSAAYAKYTATTLHAERSADVHIPAPYVAILNVASTCHTMHPTWLRRPDVHTSAPYVAILNIAPTCTSPQPTWLRGYVATQLRAVLPLWLHSAPTAVATAYSMAEGDGVLCSSTDDDDDDGREAFNANSGRHPHNSLLRGACCITSTNRRDGTGQLRHPVSEHPQTPRRLSRLWDDPVVPQTETYVDSRAPHSVVLAAVTPPSIIMIIPRSA